MPGFDHFILGLNVELFLHSIMLTMTFYNIDLLLVFPTFFFILQLRYSGWPLTNLQPWRIYWLTVRDDFYGTIPQCLLFNRQNNK